MPSPAAAARTTNPPDPCAWSVPENCDTSPETTNGPSEQLSICTTRPFPRSAPFSSRLLKARTRSRASAAVSAKSFVNTSRIPFQRHVSAGSRSQGLSVSVPPAATTTVVVGARTAEERRCAAAFVSVQSVPVSISAPQ